MADDMDSEEHEERFRVGLKHAARAAGRACPQSPLSTGAHSTPLSVLKVQPLRPRAARARSPYDLGTSMSTSPLA
jgi:hypothetical protein